ncbi:hypothetical protein ACSBR1_001136 [Camellia fascicularis]
MALSKNSQVLLFIAAFLTAISFLPSVSEAVIVARGPLNLGHKLLQDYGNDAMYSTGGGYPRPARPP